MDQSGSGSKLALCSTQRRASGPKNTHNCIAVTLILAVTTSVAHCLGGQSLLRSFEWWQQPESQRGNSRQAIRTDSTMLPVMCIVGP